MKLIDTKVPPPVEKTFVLELTEREVASLFVALGPLSNADIQRLGKSAGLQVLRTEGGRDNFYALYKGLGALIGR